MQSKIEHDPRMSSREFMDRLTERSADKLLFTSRPQPEEGDVLAKIHEVAGACGDKGDVRLTFENSTWSVSQHAVQS